MTHIIVEVKVTVASEFGDKITEITTSQRGTEGNPRFFASTAAALGVRCTSSIQSMLETEYGTKPVQT